MESPRVPIKFYDYWRATGLCIHCRTELRHELHAFNHWKKYHNKVKRYFVYDAKGARRWITVSKATYEAAKTFNIPRGREI